MDLWGHSMITSLNGKGVIVIGGKNESRGLYSNFLIELIGGTTGDWVILDQKLENGRHNHVTLVINEKLANNLLKDNIP